MAIEILPILQAILGIGTAASGSQSQGISNDALSRLLNLSEEEAEEVRNLRAILSDPNNPVRKMLLDEALRNVRGQVTTAGQGLSSRLASMGWTGAGTHAGPLAALEAAGIRAAGDVSRGSIADFLTQRIGLARPGAGMTGYAGVSSLAGGSATAAGESLGSLLSLLVPSSSGTSSYNPYGRFSLPVTRR